jgi:hypothetical protein
MNKIPLSAAVLASVVAIFLLHLYGGQIPIFSFLIEHEAPGFISAKSWKYCVEHPDQFDAYSSYDVLSKRKDPIAKEIAEKQLSSSDDYLWLNAAIYLGSIGDTSSVPYLIKALRHTAWRSQPEYITYLKTMTGMNFGDHFDLWKDWYLGQSPSVVPDWNSHLGYAPRIAVGK